MVHWAPMAILQVDVSDRAEVKRAIQTLQRILRGWEEAEVDSMDAVAPPVPEHDASDDEVQRALAARLWDHSGEGSGTRELLWGFASFEPEERFTLKDLAERIGADHTKVRGWKMRFGRTLNASARAVREDMGLAEEPWLPEQEGDRYWLHPAAREILLERAGARNVPNADASADGE